MKPVSRRNVLRGLGGATVALPFLEYFGAGSARADEAPKRLLFITTPNGTNPATCWPGGSGSSFTMSPLHAPLAAYRDDMVVLRGVDNLAAAATNINGHTDAVRCMLTGRIAANFDNVDYTAGGGISVDQHIANDIGAQSAFKSLEVVTSYIYAHPPNYCSFYGASQPAPFEDEPAKLFDRVFGDFTAPPNDPAVVARREDRVSVLHAVYDGYAALDARLGKADRERLDAHLQMVKELEQKLSKGIGAECVVPDPPAANEQNGDVSVDILVHALACDLTRVATVRTNFWDSYAFLGITGSYHDDYLHHVTTDPNAAQMVDQVKVYQAGQIAAILDKLAAVPEGTGTLFDNTLVVWVDEFCHGYAHAHDEIPYVLFCGSNRFFPMGRYQRYSTPVSTNRLLNSLIAAMDASGAGQFGDPQFGNAPLSELT
jgi:hypothetical protein